MPGNKQNELDFLEMKCVDEETKLFLENYAQTHKSTIRQAQYFEWIFAYPWVIQGKKDKEAERYFFTSKSEEFEYKLVKVVDKQKICGVLFLKIRDKHLTISHLYADENYCPVIVKYLLSFMIEEHIKTFTIFDNSIENELKKHPLNFVYRKNKKKPYIFPLNYNIHSSCFQEGDGDAVFT